MALNVFHTGLNDFCRKYFVRDTRLTPEEIAGSQKAHEEAHFQLFERFLLFDRVTFKVYGENIPVAVLLNLFGEKGICELAEQKALAFTLWTPMVGYMQDSIPGLNALCFGNVNSGVHSDPEESLVTGLNWLKNKPSKRTVKVLKSKLLPLYQTSPDDLPSDAVDVVNSAFLSGRLRPFGLDPNEVQLHSMNLAQKKLMAACAEDITELKYIFSGGLTSLSNYKYMKLLTETPDRVDVSSRVVAGFSNLCRIEGIPDLPALYSQVGGMKRVLKIRGTRSSRKFRKWIASVSSSTDAREISEEYIRAIVEPKGVLETVPGKVGKSMVMAAVGAGIGAAVQGGVVAAGIGAVVGQLLEPAASLGLDLLDKFVLDGLTKGWTPRMFFDDIRSGSELDKK